MKVVHLSSADFWEQGIIAHRIFRSVMSQGVDGIFITLMKTSGDLKVKLIIQDPVFKDKIKIVEKVSPNMPPPLFSIVDMWNKNLGIEIFKGEGHIFFSLPSTSINIGQLSEIEEADIIHVHWAPGMIDYEIAPIFFLNKPIIVTLYDSSFFTGGCHYINNCAEYKNKCDNCPLVPTESKELVKRSFELKRKVYKLLNLYIVAQNSNLELLAKDSGITSNITKIFPMTTSYFYSNNLSSKKAKEFLGLNQYSHVILFAGFYLDEKNKKYLNQMLNVINQLKQTKKIASPFIVFIGPAFENMEIQVPIPHKIMPVVPNEEVLSWYFFSADVFLDPFIDDKLSLFALDAMATGLPIIGFKQSSLEDFVDHEQDGYLANLKDEEDLKNGLIKVLTNKNKQFSRCAKEKAKKYFSFEKQGEKYVQLYQDVLKNSSKIDILKYIAWGEELYKSNRKKSALNLFEKLLIISDSNAKLLNNLGVIYWENKDMTKAIKYLEKAYKLAPHDIEIKENYEKIMKFFHE